jgi:hypothetical protein
MEFATEEFRKAYYKELNYINNWKQENDVAGVTWVTSLTPKKELF